MIDALMSLFKLLLLFAVAGGIYTAFLYNKLQGLAQGVKAEASNVQVAVGRKLAMVNQLIDVAKTYLEAEQFTHIKISEDTSTAGMLTAYQQSGTVLASLQGLSQRFPDLKANEQFNGLSASIRSCEDDIQARRTRYNATVRFYNTERLSIPAVFIARAIGFPQAEYLEFVQDGAQPTTLKVLKTDDGERLQQLIGAAGTRVSSMTRSLAHQAAEAGRVVATRVKDARHESEPDAAATYFYRVPPDGVPQGPATLEHIRALMASGALPGDVLIAQAGGVWRGLDTEEAASAGLA